MKGRDWREIPFREASPEWQKKIEKMLSHTENPSKIFMDIYGYEEFHRDYMIKTFNWFINIFEHAFDSMSHILEYLNYVDKSLWKSHNSIQFIFLANNMLTLFSAYSRLISWFYTDNLILIRPLFELILRLYYIEFYPTKREKTLYNETGQEKFNIWRFMKNDLKVDWQIYKFLSLHWHSSAADTVVQYTDIARNWQNGSINWALHLDNAKISMCINYLSFIIWNYFIFVKEFLSCWLKEYSEKVYDNLIDTEEWLRAHLVRLESKYFTDMINDILRISNDLKNN